jgi:hypothetical protein
LDIKEEEVVTKMKKAPKKKPEELTCPNPNCNKVYTKKNFYDKHVAKCLLEAEKLKEKHDAMDEKVNEINEKTRENAKKRQSLNPDDEQFWTRFWATQEGILSQQTIVASHLEKLIEILGVDKNVRSRQVAALDNAIRLIEKTMIVEDSKTREKMEKEVIREEINSTVDKMIKDEEFLEDELVSFPGDVESKFSETVELKPEETLTFFQTPKKSGFLGTDETFNETFKNSLPASSKPDLKPMDKNRPKDDGKYYDPKDFFKLEATITAETEKAVMIKSSGFEFWIPKSTIRSEFNLDATNAQIIVVDNWIIKRNKYDNKLKRLN